MCACFIFILCAGMFQTASSRSISAHSACRQLPRTDEKQRSKSQGALHDKMPLIAVYGPEKGRNLFRVCKRCMVLFSRLRQGHPLRSAEGSRSALPVATAYRKTCPAIVLIRCADSSAPRLSTRRRTASSSGALISQSGRFADPGEQITFQAAHDRDGMARRPCRGEFRMPFTGYDLEGFRFFCFCLSSAPCGRLRDQCHGQSAAGLHPVAAWHRQG